MMNFFKKKDKVTGDESPQPTVPDDQLQQEVVVMGIIQKKLISRKIDSVRAAFSTKSRKDKKNTSGGGETKSREVSQNQRLLLVLILFAGIDISLYALWRISKRGLSGNSDAANEIREEERVSPSLATPEKVKPSELKLGSFGERSLKPKVTKETSALGAKILAAKKAGKPMSDAEIAAEMVSGENPLVRFSGAEEELTPEDIERSKR
jgi:hypothetical protein